MARRNIVLWVGLAVASLASAVSFAAQPHTPQPVSITVFERPHFQGRSLTFTHSIPSMAAVGFNDATASVRINGERDWVLCEGRNFLGRCIRVHLKERDLNRLRFSGLTSSIYPVPVTPLVPRSQ